MKRAFPILAVITAALLVYAFYEAIWVASHASGLWDDVQRIFYYHVPSAWTGVSFCSP